MRTLTGLLSIVTCLALVSAATAAADEAKPPPKPTDAKPAKGDAKSKEDGGKDETGGAKKSDKKEPDLWFPEVEGWERRDREKLPGGGFVVNYRLKSKVDRGVMTIFVYDHGLEKVPDDLNDVVVLADLIAAKNAVQSMQRRGGYDEVKEEDKGTVSTLGGQKDAHKAWHAQFRIKVQGHELVSEIYDLPYRDHFFKVRADREAAAPERVREAM